MSETPSAIPEGSSPAITAVETPVPPKPEYSPVPSLYEAAEGCKGYSRPVAGILVDADGNVFEVRFIKSTGCQRADERLAEYLRTWRFKPGTRGGEPIEAEYVVGINLGG